LIVSFSEPSGDQHCSGDNSVKGVLKGMEREIKTAFGYQDEQDEEVKKLLENLEEKIPDYSSQIIEILGKNLKDAVI